MELLFGIYYGFMISKYREKLNLISDESIFAFEKNDDYKFLTNFIEGYISIEESQIKTNMIAVGQDDREQQTVIPETTENRTGNNMKQDNATASTTASRSKFT